MQSYRILVVDNNTQSRRSVEMLLSVQGYRVFAAADPIQALQLVNEQRIHLALVDIRLEDDEDAQDTTGLELAANLDPLVARIVMTGYPSYEYVRRALGAPLTDNIPASGFIAKQDSPSVLLKAVKRACSETVAINWNLELEWDDVSAEGIGSDVELDQAGLSDETLADEVEELLRKLFYKADHITVSPLSSARPHAASHSGAVLLKVQPHYQQGGWGIPVVCKIGARHQTQIEADNYKLFVRDFVGGHRRTNLEQVKCTHYLGGIIYAMLGTTLEATRDFQDFYQEADATEIDKVLAFLFQDVCRYWYASSRPPDSINLTTLYRDTLRLTDEKLKQMIERHCSHPQERKIQFEGLPGVFANPLHLICDQELESRTCCCVTHGDLHSNNIFVDEHQQVWLIDFGRTGKGHAWRDFIELETDIKFTLLKTVDLTALYHFEVALLLPERLDDLLAQPEHTTDPDIHKAFQVISTLRRMAVDVIKYDSDALPYYQGLFYQTLNVIRLKKIDAQKKQHALLSAALICERLETWGQHWSR